MPQKALLITAPVLFITTYIYTVVRLYKILPATTSLRILLIFLFILGIAGMVLFFTLGEKMPVAVSSGLYRFSTGWLIIFLYLFMAVLIVDILYLLNSLIKVIDKDTAVSIIQNNTITSAVILGVVALILISGNITYHIKKRQPLTITTSKIDAPLRIVGISDLHIGYTISAKEVSKWVDLINSENPDMVVIAGDIIDNHMRPIFRDSIETVLQRIDAPLGVYACTGNHELMFAVKEDEDFFKRAGITLLRDSSIRINDITIVGREDFTNSRRAELNKIMEEVDSSTFTLLLDHQPVNLDDAVNNGIDFQLSGHTHRGQVFPASLITDMLFELSNGYMKKNNTHFYVSSGIGIWGGKFRIGTRSEYLVLDLTPGSAD